MPTLRSEHWVSILLTFAAVLPIGSWVLMASWGEGGGLPVIEYAVSYENPTQWWFWWWALLPILLLAIAGLFYKGYAQNQKAAIGLFIALSVITVLSGFIASAMVPILLAPLYFAFRCVRGT